VYCRVCDSYDCKKVSLPYVLRYMTNELAAMNIKLGFGVEGVTDGRQMVS
jgi:DNA-directed RNA polymerase I subunit RPA2